MSFLGLKRRFSEMTDQPLLNIGDFIFEKKFIVTDFLGKGTFGSVFAVINVLNG